MGLSTVKKILLRKIIHSTSNRKISKKKIVSEIKQSLVLLLYLFLLIACFLVIFIIEAQQDESQNKAWATNFAISFIQDLTLAPLISITIKVIIIKFSQSRKTAKLKRTRTAITFLLENFKFIYVTSCFQFSLNLPF